MTIFKHIRTALGCNQSEFADLIGVSFSAVNRWEGEKAVPNFLSQQRMFQIASEKGIPAQQWIIDRIQEEAKNIVLPGDRHILYHGSKSGIQGEIAPISRRNCDFGNGFYMGTIPEQPLTLICSYEEPKFYILSVSFEGMNRLSIESTIDWAMLIAYHRGKMEDIRGSAMYEKYHSMTLEQDYLIGCIADDRMFVVLDNFFQGLITDVALVHSLFALNLGQQYVALTQKACHGIRIEKEISLLPLEKMFLQKKAAENRQEGIRLTESICKEYRREGRYFDEILQEVKV